ncbi:MOSC domain-containing protein [Alkalihalobacillus pseudalcaliphilus]|uniref:MOSC domain-containing protein n=1 Tax=Alkalihalobacillus pseudalcaliphilus TaxID=79884 RepID=UPI00064DC616|nr:MOSC domain-containing protein [Alkalihalobacillus pseudalcaliphilus]KMK74813.1 molybdenum cofactor biosysynthesis protein [Alkalihalobacillus pseudalcaliphilus]
MGRVTAVSKNAEHSFSKHIQEGIQLLKGLGVKGDAHCGETVKHRSRIAKNPNQPNLRQVHLIHEELFHELNNRFHINPGELGENITTKGIELLMLPVDTVLEIGENAKVQLTGLRNPCKQIDHYQDGLMEAVLDKDESGHVIRKAGVMGIVLEGGMVSPGDSIKVVLPDEPHLKLDKI